MIAELAEPRISASVPRPFPPFGVGSGDETNAYGIRPVCTVIIKLSWTIALVFQLLWYTFTTFSLPLVHIVVVIFNTKIIRS